MKPRDALQNGLFEHKKTKSGVSLSQVCKLRTTHSSVLKASQIGHFLMVSFGVHPYQPTLDFAFFILE